MFITDGDIKKAYDFASHAAFAEAARSRGMPEVFIHTWLREWRRMTHIFRLDAETTSAEVARTRSFPQGDPAAPIIFNLVLDTIAENFIKTAVNKRWGKRIQDRSGVSLILVADNDWLVATTPEMLSAMTNEWLRLLGGVGWETPTENLTWCTAAEDEFAANIRVKGTLTRRAGRNIAL